MKSAQCISLIGTNLTNRKFLDANKFAFSKIPFLETNLLKKSAKNQISKLTTVHSCYYYRSYTTYHKYKLYETTLRRIWCCLMVNCITLSHMWDLITTTEIWLFGKGNCKNGIIDGNLPWWTSTKNGICRKACRKKEPKKERVIVINVIPLI